MIGLENQTDAMIAPAGQGGWGKLADIGGVKKNFAGVGKVEPAEEVEESAFSGAGSAAQGEKFAAHDGEINAAQDFEIPPAHGVGFAQAASNDDGRGVNHSATPRRVGDG